MSVKPETLERAREQCDEGDYRSMDELVRDLLNAQESNQ